MDDLEHVKQCQTQWPYSLLLCSLNCEDQLLFDMRFIKGIHWHPS